jgi:putative molybdopterin biosynthesis protein
MTERNIFLEDLPMDEVLARLDAALHAAGKADALAGESVKLRHAAGRVTAEACYAKRSSPHFHASAMDGYAVRTADTVGATETHPLALREGEQAIPVNTGEPLPPGMNAVIMIENVEQTDDAILIRAAVAPYQHVRPMGEDMVVTEMILPANHTLRPVDLGALAACGYADVVVRRPPFVVLIPTGDELVPIGETPRAGQHTEYNSLVLAAQIEGAGGRAEILPFVPDQREALSDAIGAALSRQPDLLLILSGSSAGSKDFTASIVRDVGELLAHGVAVRPGHPVVFGMVSGTPVIGVPGYPVSAALTGEIFVLPLVARWLGQTAPMARLPHTKAVMARKLASPPGDDDFVRVTLALVEDKLLATPLSRGAGMISSLVRADGLAHVPRFSEGVDQGGEIDVLLYTSLDALVRTALFIGSHDPMLDLLAAFIAEHFNARMVSSHVGSLGGLAALRRGEAHAAGIHLLDPETGDFNLSYVRKYLPETPVRLITFAHREQGLLVAKGNPLDIRSIDDLPRVRYVNRQRGAGTRVLLDYELTKRGILPEAIRGYEREEYTHLAVATAIASGTADCGLGVHSGAVALDLDFVPMAWERYDLVIPEAHVEHPAIRAVLDALNNDSFRAQLAAQPGYSVESTGQQQNTRE